MSQTRDAESPSPDESADQPIFRDPYQRPDQAQIRYLAGRNPGDPEAIHVRLSVRRRRRLVSLCVLAATIGGLLVVFQSPMRNELLAPGPLTSKHAQILAGMGGDRCAACHSAGKDSWLSWVGLTSPSQADCSVNQSDLCLKCHQQTIPVQLATNPHSLDGAQLQQLTQKQEAKFRLAGMPLAPKEQQRELSCAACHQEHHGAEIDLTAMTDQQCQTCHTRQHQSFEKDHPEFALVGTQLPKTLNFDHAGHFQKYFPEGQREFSCAQCHVGDGQKNVMRLASYEAMCASCHDQTIRTSGQQGLVLLELPMLDLDSLRSAGIEVGAWPQEARGDFAGRLHPLTWALLSRNESLRETLRTFPADFDFGDIDRDDPNQLRKLGELVRGIKQLLVELGTQDLPDAMGLSTANLPAHRSASSELQFFRDAVAAWFPEMAAQGGVAEAKRSPRGRSEERLWLPRSQAVANWLQEQELLAPNPLVGKVSPKEAAGTERSEAASAQAAPAAQATAEAGPSRQVIDRDAIKNDLRIVDDNSRQERETDLPSLRGELTVPPANASADSIQLAENPLKGMRPAEKPEVSKQQKELTEQDPSDSIDNLGPQRTPHAPPHKSAENQPAQAPAIEPVFSALSKNQLPQPSLLRGWRRDDQTFRLVYFVAEHGDAFWPELQRWHASLEESGHHDSARLLSDWLSKPGTAGDCLSCHSPRSEWARSDAAPADPLASWISAMRLPDRKGFTRFNHAPHLLQLKCADCHQLTVDSPEGTAKGPAQLASWPRGEPAARGAAADLARKSDFAAIGRSTCIQCHRQEQASSSCTTCHAYHVDQQWAKTLQQLEQLKQE